MSQGIVSKVVDFFLDIVDTKVGAIIGTLLIMAFFGFGLPAIVNTVQTATAEGFTGTAVVQNHKVYGSFCNVEIQQENGETVKMTYGPKMTCQQVTDGMTVNLLNGRLTK